MGNSNQNQQQQTTNSTSDNNNQKNNDDQPDCSQQSSKRKVIINDQELRSRLTPIQYAVTQEKATERPFSGEYNEHQEVGQYLCVVCEQKLFTSDSKFPTHCGWPGFKKPVSSDNVELKEDFSHNMVRTEVTCSACNAHLGHVFDDGPYPERTRYCINSAALKFIKKLPK